MNQDDTHDPTYVMGRSEDEARRLEERAEFFERPTRLLFEDAGITPPCGRRCTRSATTARRPAAG